MLAQAVLLVALAQPVPDYDRTKDHWLWCAIEPSRIQRALFSLRRTGRPAVRCIKQHSAGGEPRKYRCNRDGSLCLIAVHRGCAGSLFPANFLRWRSRNPTRCRRHEAMIRYLASTSEWQEEEKQ